MNQIGFIGLGHMGLPMAICLIKSGYSVVGFDVNSTVLDAFRAAGGMVGATLSEALVGKDTVLTMLQTGQQVQDVCCGEHGLFATMPAGSVWIDCSSIDVASSRMLHQKALDLGIRALDAPVSGGVKGAKAGRLTFMVGGSEDLFQQVSPLLHCMGSTVIYTGVAGSGQAAKICNNMILGVSMIAVSEAFLLAERLGLTAEKLFEVVNHASGQCWVMSQYVPVPGLLEHVPANQDYQPGFTAAMMLKDLNTSQQASEATGIRTPMAAQATALYQQLNKEGMSHLDFSCIVEWLKTT